MQANWESVKNKSVPPPPRRLNGGLYTGQPFEKDAPWANLSVIPEAGYMTYVNLRSANPPPDALMQYPGNIRPGNNYQYMPGVSRLSIKTNLWCNDSPCKAPPSPCTCNKCRFSKYAHM